MMIIGVLMKIMINVMITKQNAKAFAQKQIINIRNVVKDQKNIN